MARGHEATADPNGDIASGPGGMIKALDRKVDVRSSAGRSRRSAHVLVDEDCYPTAQIGQTHLRNVFTKSASLCVPSPPSST